MLGAFRNGRVESSLPAPNVVVSYRCFTSLLLFSLYEDNGPRACSHVPTQTPTPKFGPISFNIVSMVEEQNGFETYLAQILVRTSTSIGPWRAKYWAKFRCLCLCRYVWTSLERHNEWCLQTTLGYKREGSKPPTQAVNRVYVRPMNLAENDCCVNVLWVKEAESLWTGFLGNCCTEWCMF